MTTKGRLGLILGVLVPTVYKKGAQISIFLSSYKAAPCRASGCDLTF